MRKGELKQEAILSFLKDYLDTNPFPPSYREIAKGVGIKSTNSVKKYLDILEEKNLIRRRDYQNRSIEIVKKDYSSAKDLISIPLIGKVAAGNPILAFESVEDEFIISKSIFGTSQELFMLKISGDSMIEIGIDDGDYRLTETVVPANYTGIETIYFTIDATHDKDSEDPKLTELSVKNEKDHALFANATFGDDPSKGVVTLGDDDAIKLSIPNVKRGQIPVTKTWAGAVDESLIRSITYQITRFINVTEGGTTKKIEDEAFKEARAHTVRIVRSKPGDPTECIEFANDGTSGNDGHWGYVWSNLQT